MLTVTAAAKEKLKELLKERATDQEAVMRIIRSPSNPKRLEFVLAREEEGDQVVESEEGRKVLLIAPDVAPTLEGMVIDHQESAEGAVFTISMRAPNT